MACRTNQSSSSFTKAANTLFRTAHIQMSKETLRQLVEEEGKLVLQAMRRSELLPDWSADDCVVEATGTTDEAAPPTEGIGESPAVESPVEKPIRRVYLGCDGVKVPLVTDEEKKKRRKKVLEKRRRRGRKCKPLSPRRAGSDNAYKEFKVSHLYDGTKQHRYVGVTSGNHQAAGKMMRRMADQVELPRADEIIALIDGAPWIRNQIEFHGLTENIGLDFWHLKDYAQKARNVVFGVESDDGKQWLGKLLHTLKHDGFDAAYDQLTTWRKPMRGAKRTAANRLLQYAAERYDLIRYPEFRKRGWEIGSGPTEAACKTTTQRVKGRGRRWNAANAEAMMALAALEDSRMWKQRWATLDPERN